MTHRKKLKTTVNVYNFEVEDFHTYYVGIQGILVHNVCPPGRKNKQKRLKQLAKDDKVSSALKGEIKRDLNQVARGKRKTVRVPSGYQLSHWNGFSAKNGYDYMHSNLLMAKQHRIHHAIFGYK